MRKLRNVFIATSLSAILASSSVNAETSPAPESREKSIIKDYLAPAGIFGAYLAILGGAIYTRATSKSVKNNSTGEMRF